MNPAVPNYSNILDYLKWRGDLPICNAFPLNEIDHLILARFSYLDFRAVGYGGIERLASLCKEITKLPNEHFIVFNDKLLAEALTHAPRFKDLSVSNIVINNDVESEKQFGALSVLLPNNEIFISYLGTDDTINGWKEDFNMTFLEHIPSQVDGLEYLEMIAEKFPKSKIRIGGHSKGGNIAMFAALSAPDGIQKRILSVDNYDGPGFDHDRVQFHKTPEIMAKITTYFPQESMIGRLLDHSEKSIVIESVESGLMQHDIYSWLVNVTSFVRIKDVKQVRFVLNKSLRKLLDQCSIEQRKLVIDTIHEAIISANYKRLSDLRKDPLHALPSVFKSYKSNTTAEERKQISNIVKEFARNYYEINKANSKDQKQKNAEAKRVNREAAKIRRDAIKKSGFPVEKPFF